MCDSVHWRIDRYEVLLFLHVVGVIIWVGVGVTMFFLLVWADRSGDRRFVAGLLSASEWLGNPVTVALLLLLGTGIWLVLDGPWSFGDTWVALGLGGYVVALAWASRVEEREMKHLSALVREHGPDAPEVSAGGRRLLAGLTVELAILAVVVLGMTVKPAAGAVEFWAVVAAILAGAGWLALRGYRSAAVPADAPPEAPGA
jgi:uncharacterized membrane protein